MGDTGDRGDTSGAGAPPARRPPGASFTIESLLSGPGAAPSPEPPGRSPPDKPAQSYIALISTAILSSPEKKLLLCDIYQWIMDNYPYFKNKVREGGGGSWGFSPGLGLLWGGELARLC